MPAVSCRSTGFVDSLTENTLRPQAAISTRDGESSAVETAARRGVAASEAAASARSSSPAWEWRRKLTHVVPGLIPFVMWFVYHEDPLPAWNLAVASGVVALLTAMAIHGARDAQRSRDEPWARTCVTYAAVPLLTLILFPANAEFASVVLCVLAFGDAGAALGGGLMGKRRLPWNPAKTWMGMLCFVLAAAPPAIVAYWGEARPNVAWWTAVTCGATAVGPAAIAESVRSPIDDNVRICLAAAAGVVIAHHALIGAGA